jgi:hypothetical protein
MGITFDLGAQGVVPAAQAPISTHKSNAEAWN